MGDVSYEPIIRDMTWSYSRIKAFDDCPYRWYLKYIRFPHLSGKPLFFSAYGSFLHELLEAYYKGEITEADAQDRYLMEFRQKVSAPAPSQKVFESYFADGIGALRRLQPPQEDVLAVEEKMEFSIEGIPFVGYIDRIDADEKHSLCITDHKSRALKPRSKRAKQTKTDRELDEYLRQLYLYSAAVEQKFGELPSKLCFNCFRKGVVIEETFDESAYHEAIDWCKDKIECIATEQDFRPDIEYFKCRHLCEMQDLCDYYRISRG